MIKIGAIVLAAGQGKRFGIDKLVQKLPDGRPIIRHIVEVVCRTSLFPVMVITISDDRMIHESLKGLDVHYLENPNPQLGISSSLQIGVDATRADCQACMIVLGDQPFISTDLLELLIDEYNNSQAQIVFPVVDNIRSNPVILDRTVFSSIMELKGDIGARVIFPKFVNHIVHWSDSRLLLDIDTPDDLAHIQELWNGNLNNQYLLWIP